MLFSSAGKRVLWDLPGRIFRFASSCRRAARWRETECSRARAGRPVPGGSRAVSAAAAAAGSPEKSSSCRVKCTGTARSYRKTNSQWTAVTSCSSTSFFSPWSAAAALSAKCTRVPEPRCAAGTWCRSSASERPRLAKRSVLIVRHYWSLSISHRSVYSEKVKIRR